MTAMPTAGMIDHPDTSFLFPSTNHLVPLDNNRTRNQLRAYHASLDRWEAMENPKSEEAQWVVEKIIKHSTKKMPSGKNSIFLKGQYVGGDKAWFRLDTLRLDDPYLVINYALSKDLQKLPEFGWIDDYFEFDKVSERIVQANKVRQITEKKFKFGVEVPRNPKHALELDKEKGNNGWGESTKKELDQILNYEVFKVLPEGQPIPKGYKKIPYHIVYDVKFDGRLKSRLVAGGHRSPPVPREEVFSGVVSMEAVRLDHATGQQHPFGKYVKTSENS